ncbi:MAG: ATP-binding protein [Pseudomonadota bacterium]|nr:ATP-binding protein [Pseudomonadota bacterium]
MRRSGRFFLRLLVVAAVAALPLIALHAYTLVEYLQLARAHALQDLQTRSSAAARVTEDTLRETEQLLAFVAAHDEVRRLDAPGCGVLLRGLEAVEPVQGVVSVFGTDGRPVCASIDFPEARARNVASAPWFASALPANGYVLSEPFLAMPNAQVIALSFPVRAFSGAKVGLASITLDLPRLQAKLASDWAEPRGVIALVSGTERVLALSPPSWKGVGPRGIAGDGALPGGPPVARMAAVEDADGQSRLVATSPLSRYGLRVIVSVPEDDVLAAPRAHIRRSLLTSILPFLLAGAAVWLGARRLARPIRRLVEATKGKSVDGVVPFADEALPGEIGELAHEMNRMNHARRTSERESAQARQRSERLSRFYETMLRTNQAIARAAGPLALYEAMCQICVETEQAEMAWVGLIEGNKLKPVAFGGPAALYTRELDVRLSATAPVPGPGLTAIQTGEIYVANDFLNDARTAPYLENAAPLGVRSSCAIPFRCRAEIVGILCLYSNEVGFFDQAVLHLLNGLSADVSHALDNFAREADHRRTLAELRDSESRMAGIVESSLDAVITVDDRGRVKVFNRAASRLFDIPVSAALESSLERFIPGQHDVLEGPSTDSCLERAGTAQRLNRDQDIMGRRRSGEPFALQASVVRMQVQDQVLTTFIVRDATVEKAAARARVEAARAVASNQAKNDFLSQMSHELRTPLNVVLGFSQVLQEDARDRLTEREIKQLDLIFLAGAQLRALVDDVLDFSVIESGRLDLALRDFELIELLDGVLRMSEAAARAGSVRVQADFEAVRPLVMHSDPIRLRQIVLNLLSNAIKYNRAGGNVTVAVDAEDGRVRIEVADNGFGMTAEQVAGLFQPFNRLGRERSDIHGTGIGMVLVRQLVELMDGRLDVQSTAGEGTTVTVELPRSRAGATLGNSGAGEGAGAACEAPSLVPLDGVVLYIEDNPVNVLLVEEILKIWPGIQMVVAETGERGIRDARTLRPDLVLLDMQLPDMSGLEVLRVLKADAATRQSTVVSLSASAMAEDVEQALAQGVTEYWKKPVDVHEFRRGMRRLLESPARALSE